MLRLLRLFEVYLIRFPDLTIVEVGLNPSDSTVSETFSVRSLSHPNAASHFFGAPLSPLSLHTTLSITVGSLAPAKHHLCLTVWAPSAQQAATQISISDHLPPAYPQGKKNPISPDQRFTFIRSLSSCLPSATAWTTVTMSQHSRVCWGPGYISPCAFSLCAWYVSYVFLFSFISVSAGCTLLLHSFLQQPLLALLLILPQPLWNIALFWLYSISSCSVPIQDYITHLRPIMAHELTFPLPRHPQIYLKQSIQYRQAWALSHHFIFHLNLNLSPSEPKWTYINQWSSHRASSQSLCTSGSTTISAEFCPSPGFSQATLWSLLQHQDNFQTRNVRQERGGK